MTAVQKTTNYEMFKFRDDNRASINKTHVTRLAESIKARNLLEMAPITVNKDMEVMDGQHRLLAAKDLGVAIYYKVEEDLESTDIILMNVSKAWLVGDYMNYFVKNKYPEYVKLEEFMKLKNLPLRVALNFTAGQTNEAHMKFKKGEYIFTEESIDDDVDMCWDTIGYIKKMNGYSNYTASTKFWAALIALTRSVNFSAEKWRNNLKRMVDRCGPRVTTKDYIQMLMDIHNWRNPHKVEIENEY